MRTQYVNIHWVRNKIVFENYYYIIIVIIIIMIILLVILYAHLFYCLLFLIT